MHDILCPHCGKAFKIDESGYADIVKQVRDEQFEQQLHERLELAEQDKRNAVELAQAQLTSAMQLAAATKDAEIQELKAKLDAGEIARQLAVAEALAAVEKEQARLLELLAKTPWHPVGTPVAWFYDPPWTLPAFRRNEVAVEVRSAT